VFSSLPPPAMPDAPPVHIIASADPLPSPAEAPDSPEPLPSAAASTPQTAPLPAGPGARPRRRWPEAALWVVAVVGLGWAVTGALHIALPGVPARLPPAWGKWLGQSAPPPTAPNGVPAASGPVGSGPR
jgi:hypothetical protein